MFSCYNFPVYSVLDNCVKFDGKIEDGNYYIDASSYFPFRGNGIYARALIEYGLNENIITMDNIKLQFKSSLLVKDDYFKGFINHSLDVFSFDKDAVKLAPKKNW